MIETTKKALYATVGAPVITAKRVNEKFQEITSRLRDTDISAEFEAWVAEGEKLMDRFGDQPVIEDISSRLDDLDMTAQVGKLREQLDEMVANWRKNFRPADTAVKVEENPAPTKEPAKSASKTAASKTAAKKTTKSSTKSTPAATTKKAAPKTTAKSSASKSSSSKSTAAKTTKKA